MSSPPGESENGRYGAEPAPEPAALAALRAAAADCNASIGSFSDEQVAEGRALSQKLLALFPGFNAEVELDKWVAAKRAKDFATADAIREKLRANGVDPDRARPRDHFPGAGGGAAGFGGRPGF
eukprot:scaffold12197_cov90-Isochrysis_galbana.AAC.1